ncbi:hypothetical protein [Lusitaniella coriacea]|uniref:hypothetical protein n=1 Tax=Lusitaniella coriacea TaxID=1983105 RepID=UPI003CEDF770
MNQNEFLSNNHLETKTESSVDRQKKKRPTTRDHINEMEARLTIYLDRIEERSQEQFEQFKEQFVQTIQYQLNQSDRFEEQLTQQVDCLQTQLRTTAQHQLKHSQNNGTEEELIQRIYWLQKRLAILERKIDTQRKFLFALMILGASFLYLTIFHTPKQKTFPQFPPVEQKIELQPKLQGFQTPPLEPQHLNKFFGNATLTKTPVKGQKIRGKWRLYAVTDTYRIRMVHPATKQRSPPQCVGKSLEEVDKQGIVGCIAHRGIDVAAPIGTPLFAIAYSQAKTQVECIKQPPWGTYAKLTSASLPGWTFIAHHLNTCRPGLYQSGQVFGTTGTAGTGPHLHFGSKYRGRYLAPPLGFVQWMLAGEKPKL